MTTYLHTLHFSDGESIALREALEAYIATCDQKIAQGARSPYTALRRHAQDVLDRLHDNSVQTSGNNFY